MRNTRGKRIKREVFRASDGTKINADVNGALNIIKKAILKAFVNERGRDRGCGLHLMRCIIGGTV
ncbi:MAG: hypothetical protein EF813_09600 [Methanosarcinales archaeon]|nr:MAG: hypothetical protein EF813_09600 [Methanosarcinales archaeon]